jgi:triacylglycerol lipase
MIIYKEFSPLVPSTHYNKNNALSLALACQLAYEDPDQIQSTINSWGFRQVELINVKKGSDIDTQGFIMEDENNIVVVFRGSDSGADWFANFQASQDPGPLSNTGAHEGFQDALFPVVIALTKHVYSREARQKSIWITGHSLGGALSSLYAGMLFENGIDVYGVYTFASPRPGSHDFATQLNDKLESGPHYRVVNSGDIVPHLPPEPFFSHPGKRIILKTNRIEREEDSWLEERIEALKHFIKVTGEKFDIVDNHRLVGDDESYIQRLIKDLERGVGDK